MQVESSQDIASMLNAAERLKEIARLRAMNRNGRITTWTNLQLGITQLVQDLRLEGHSIEMDKDRQIWVVNQQ